ncbi:MAG: glycosyltransferase [Cyanobacteria bacterium RM1_2_2]|nr:glycosyltransferase [Cyanobacteria bacterium RM1_2_2]
MKVAFLSVEDDGSGSTRAAYRLHCCLKQAGIQSQMLVQSKHRDDKTVIGLPAKTGVGKIVSGSRSILDRLPLKLYSQRESTSFSPQWLPDRIGAKVAQLNPDLISLQWVNLGYLQIETLAKFKKPIVWTLRDMWAFTGGCHYNGECDRYTKSCGACPQLHSQRDADLSRWIWQRKAKAWKEVDLTIVALSSWLGDCAAASSLFGDRRVEVIPNGIDTDTYRPIDRQTARALLNLPPDKRLILFGAVNAASDKRKGFHLLQPALQSLRQMLSSNDVELVIFGASKPENPPDLGFTTRYLGTWNDDLSLALLYSAADVFVAPSVQENLANTVLEALACGLPCVAFKIGGMPDLIEHQYNGYLAKPYHVEDLTQGMLWILENAERHQKLSNAARQKIEAEFTMKATGTKYLSLFTELLENQ